MIAAHAKARSTSIRAVVTRADGTVENRGLISYRSRNLLKHYAVNTYIRIKDFINGRARPKRRIG